MALKTKAGEEGSTESDKGGLRKRLFLRGGGRSKKKDAHSSAPSAAVGVSAPEPKHATIISNNPPTTTSASKSTSNSAISTTTSGASAAAASSASPKKGILKNKSEETPIRDAPHRTAELKRRKPRLKKPSWFCRTAYFQKLCDASFEIVDADHSGGVDVNELYSGLLLIHLKLGTYCGPAACRPLSRDRCQAVFQKMDADRSGTLDRDEFRNVMMVLFSNVVFRVAVQWSMTLMIVPVVARAILDALVKVMQFTLNFIATLDEDYEFADELELTIESTWDKMVRLSPDFLVRAVIQVRDYLALVPESVWEALPLTMLSTILGIAVVPWCIFQVDDFFQRIADRKAAKALRENKGAWI